MSIDTPRGRSAAYRLPGVVALALLGGGGIWTAHRAERDHRSSSVFTPTARKLLWLHAGSADIVISPGAGSRIRIERRARWVGSRPTPSYHDSGGRIDLQDDCHSSIGLAASMFAFHDPCSVTYRITVPVHQSVRLEAGSGDVVLTGLQGRVSASTGSGDVSADGLGGTAVLLASGSGDVSATFAHAPTSLRATAGSGDVSLHVPGGAYRITASTGSGDRSISGLGESSAATHSIYARTGSGDVSIGRSDG
jgi:hypothetical protein